MTPSLIKPVSPWVYQLTQTSRDHDKWPPLSSHSDTSPSPRSKNVGSYGNANSLEQNWNQGRHQDPAWRGTWHWETTCSCRLKRVLTGSFYCYSSTYSYTHWKSLDNSIQALVLTFSTHDTCIKITSAVTWLLPEQWHCMLTLFSTLLNWADPSLGEIGLPLWMWSFSPLWTHKCRETDDRSKSTTSFYAWWCSLRIELH